ncbi:MAG: G8 domain-containing protein [Bacteroidota bacterium]
MTLSTNNSLKTALFALVCFAWATIFIPRLNAQSPVEVAGTANKTAVSSGNWTAPSTWGGTLPTTDARIHIPAGLTITVDTEIATEFKSLKIDGTLKFATSVNTELRVEYIVSTMMGRLEIGTASDPVATGVTAKLVFADRGGTTPAQDFQRFAPGAVLMGAVEMRGQAKTSWTTLGVHPNAGANSLELSSMPVGWKNGDQLIVAATEIGDPTSDDVVEISSIAGTTIHLTSPLLKSHKAPAEASDLDVHVANLTRNIRISSENKSVAAKRRGHIMFMHHLNVDVRYVELDHLGRTDKIQGLDDYMWPDLEEHASFNPPQGDFTNPRGRYSLHFHRGGVDPALAPAHIEGVTVNNDPGWGFVNHSSRVDFIKNVSYDVVGGAFNTEAGDETGSFIENIALRTVNPNFPFADLRAEAALLDAREGAQDFAWQGDAFWFHSTGVTIEGNVAAGVTGHAFIFWPEGLIEKGLGMMRGSIPFHVTDPAQAAMFTGLPNNFVLECWLIPQKPFRNNTAYNSTKGLSVYYLQTRFLETESSFKSNIPTQAYRNSLNAVFEGTTIWNINHKGIEMLYASDITIKDSRIVGYGSSADVVGMDLDHWHNLDDWFFINNTVEGFDNSNIGLSPPTNATVTIDGGNYNNTATDIRIRETNFSIFHEGPLDETVVSRTMSISNMVFNHPDNNIVLQPELILTHPIEDGFDLADEEKYLYYFGLGDEITLNYGPFQNATLYFNEQAADFVPINNSNYQAPTVPGEPAGESIPSIYRNKTNAQLQGIFNPATSFGGKLLPASAVGHPSIVGGKVSAVSGNPCNGVVPPSPSAVTASNNACNSINVNWSSANCADTYRVQRKVDTGNWVTLDNAATGTSYTDNNPPAGSLSYRVRAQNDNGNSAEQTSGTIDCTGNPIQFTLATNIAGSGNGTISLSPAGGIYDQGTVVTVTATPDVNSQFDGWSGTISGPTNPLTIMMNANQTITADFSASTPPPPPPTGCTWATIDANDFESGWGIWNDGGSDCRRSIHDDEFAASGEYCVRLRDNTNTSVMTTDDLDLSNFEEIKVEFAYVCISMDNSNEDFWLQISTDGGDSFVTVEEWNEGDEFENEEGYLDVVTIAGMTFTENTQLRFRCDASGNADKVYIDDVTISGCGSSGGGGGGNGGAIQVVNFSFEEPGSGDLEDNFSNIPGWSKGGDGDSGVEKGYGDPTNGEWLCFHEKGDNYIHQTLNHAIEAGKTYTLELDVKDLDDAGAKAQVLLKYGGTNIKNVQLPLTEDWQTMTVSFDSDNYPDAIGEDLRIFFRNNGDFDSYASFDNLRLTQTTALSVPALPNLSIIDETPDLPNRHLRVFPNPVLPGRELKIELLGFAENSVVTVLDVNGKIVRQTVAMETVFITTEQLSAGLYFIKVRDEAGTKTTRFVVQE